MTVQLYILTKSVFDMRVKESHPKTGLMTNSNSWYMTLLSLRKVIDTQVFTSITIR